MKKTWIFTLLTLLVVSLTGCTSIENDIIFELVLGEEYTIDVNQNYIEPGYIAKYKSQDISENVVVTGEVDPTSEGLYNLTYTLSYKGETFVKTRTVRVGAFNTRCNNIDNSNLMGCAIVWTSYLNTKVELSLYVPRDTELNTDTVFSEIEEILAYFTIMSDKYKPYDGMNNVHEINNKAGEVVVVDERLFDLIDFTLTNQEDVIDYYNAALGPVLQIWHNYRENCNNIDACGVPTIEGLQAANAYTDPSKILLDRENHTIKLEENMSIDLGGVSKGYVSGKIIEYLDTLDLHGYLLNNGESNISVGGKHPLRENQKFIIAVTDPTFQLPYYATVYLEDGEQLVTSGDYQKFYIADEQKYHHIISPVTLFPESNSRSVSIITNDPALADLYSTAIFNMTISEGKDFVNNIDGLEAIWYGMDGTIHFSDNFESNHLVETFE